MSDWKQKDVEALGEYLTARTAEAFQDEIARLKTLNGELVATLREAKRTIKALHGPVAWDIYDANSPEMKKINTALAKADQASREAER